MDDYFRFILAHRLQRDMTSRSFIDVIQDAVDMTDTDRVPVTDRTRLLSDRGASSNYRTEKTVQQSSQGVDQTSRPSLTSLLFKRPTFAGCQHLLSQCHSFHPWGDIPLDQLATDIIVEQRHKRRHYRAIVSCASGVYYLTAQAFNPRSLSHGHSTPAIAAQDLEIPLGILDKRRWLG